MSDSQPTPAEANVARLHELLQLRRLDSDAGPRESDLFVGPSQYKPDGRVFGGQVLAQCIVAAAATLPPDRLIHSLHGYFLRAGDVAEPIEFGVERLRDGRSFSARRVHAYQKDAPILSLIASFQEEQEGLEHAEHAPEAPDPEGLPTTAEVLAGIEHPVAEYWSTQRPIDIRHVTDPIYLRPDANGGTIDAQMVWMRTLAPVDADPLLHDAILAFASDYTPFEPILRKQGLSWMTPGLKMATIDHAIWWHRHVRADEWLLYVQRSPSASGGRGLTHGQIFDRSGELVATVTQEGMIRAPRRG